jgi:hypothetical protein
MADDLARYRAYLLRLWRTAEATWRGSLEDPHSGERRVFVTLAELVAFLERELESRPAHASKRIQLSGMNTQSPGSGPEDNPAGGAHNSREPWRSGR